MSTTDYPWQCHLERVPCLSLGQFPPPLEPLPRLSIALQRPIWIKRDDSYVD